MEVATPEGTQSATPEGAQPNAAARRTSMLGGWPPPEARGPEEQEEEAPHASTNDLVRVVLTWFACLAAPAMVGGGPMFIKMFADAGVLKSVCASVGPGGCKAQQDELSSLFSLIGAAAMLPQIPIGMAYDWPKIHARGLSISGSVLCSVGIFLCCAAIRASERGHDPHSKYLLIVGLSANTWGGIMSGFSMMGFLYHFPGRQGMLIGAMLAAGQVGSFLPILVELLMGWCSASLCTVLLGIGWLCLACCAILYVTVPTHEESSARAKAVLGLDAAPPPTEFRHLWSNLSRGWQVIDVYLWRHVAMQCSMVLVLILMNFYGSVANTFGEALLGSERAGTRLGEAVVFICGITGFASPVFGLVCDLFGMEYLLMLSVLCIGLALAVCQAASLPVQMVTCFFLSVSGLATSTWCIRYCVYYSPPDRFGTVSSLSLSSAAVMQMVVVGLLMSAVRHGGSGVESYMRPLVFALVAALLAQGMYTIWFVGNPPPDVPPLLQEENTRRKLAAQRKTTTF